jgi:hypothetical protein
VFSPTTLLTGYYCVLGRSWCFHQLHYSQDIIVFRRLQVGSSVLPDLTGGCISNTPF